MANKMRLVADDDYERLVKKPKVARLNENFFHATEDNANSVLNNIKFLKILGFNCTDQ